MNENIQKNFIEEPKQIDSGTERACFAASVLAFPSNSEQKPLKAFKHSSGKHLSTKATKQPSKEGARQVPHFQRIGKKACKKFRPYAGAEGYLTKLTQGWGGFRLPQKGAPKG